MFACEYGAARIRTLTPEKQTFHQSRDNESAARDAYTMDRQAVRPFSMSMYFASYETLRYATASFVSLRKNRLPAIFAARCAPLVLGAAAKELSP